MDEGIDLFSFDVFDTLLTRITVNPYGIFLIMQNRLKKDMYYMNVSSSLKNDFCFLRVQVEKYLRQEAKKKSIQEIDLDQIYRFIAFHYGLSSLEEKSLKRLEIQTEMDNILPITANISRLRKLLRNGKKTILISDMYLSEEIIRKILCKIDEVFCNIRIYVSSQYLVTKKDGELYEIVKQHEAVDFNRWLHVGDNYHSDVKSARKLGIRTEYFKFNQFTFYENCILKNNVNNISIQVVVGIARYIRILNENNVNKIVGCSLGASMLFPYVSWVLEQSRKRKFKRLYFIARDGYILKIIADLIMQNNDYDLRTYYIYGSREAWRIPSVLNEVDDFSFVFNETCEISDLQSVADRFQIELDELEKFLPKGYFNNLLKRKDIETIKNMLVNSAEFRRFIIHKNEAKRQSIIGYLKQEIDISDDHFAFVELRGSGVTQDCLARIFSIFYNNPIKTFFYNLGSSNQIDSLKYVYLPNIEPDYTGVLEVFCRALHGQTIGYEYINSNFVPILENLEGKALIEYQYDAYIEGIKEFVTYYLNFSGKLHLEFPAQIGMEYLKLVNEKPDKSAVDFIANVPFINIGKVKCVREYAPKLTLINLIKVFICMNKKSIKTSNAFFSAQRSSRMIKFLFMKYITVKKVIGFFLSG